MFLYLFSVCVHVCPQMHTLRNAHVVRGQLSGLGSLLPRGLSGCHAWRVYTLWAVLPALTGYVLKGQSEKKAELSVNVAVISVWRRCCLQMILLMDAFINKVRVGAVLTPPPPHMLPHWPWAFQFNPTVLRDVPRRWPEFSTMARKLILTFNFSL